MLRTLPLMLAALVASVPAAAQGDLPVSNTGAVFSTESAATEGSPFSGTGQLTARDIRESAEGYTPSAEEIRGLPASGADNGIESVIGLDTRERVYTTTYPARAKVLITFTGGFCSGFFYGPNIVATAGHCVHTGGPGGAWRTNVRVYPGYNAGVAPYGSFAAKWLASVTGWTSSSNELYDYGVVKLNSNVGNTVGWFGYFGQLASLTGTPSVVEGYPGDKSPAKSQWTATDMVRSSSTEQIFYKNDTAGGESGSAVWHDRPPGSTGCSNGPCAYGIHAYGLHGGSPHSTHNHGIRFTAAKLANLAAWRAAP
jgi:glutamyl endopeptidase